MAGRRGAAQRGAAADAFDVVIPSIPAYGFSAKPATSDWGTSISSMLGVLDAEHVAGIHLVPPLAGPDPSDDLTAAEREALARMRHRGRTASAYSEMHRTAPQTVGYALLDSPAGLCAWMGEKLIAWSDHRLGPADDLPGALTRDQILDQVTLYWLTGTAASSARLYAESIDTVSRWITGASADPVHVPVGASVFPAEVPRTSRRWAARRYPDIRYWMEHDRGGHFPALEVPDLLVRDLRAFFRPLR